MMMMMLKKTTEVPILATKREIRDVVACLPPLEQNSIETNDLQY
jgi:hypothetical protein